jgi:hypothetical protein
MFPNRWCTHRARTVGRFVGTTGRRREHMTSGIWVVAHRAAEHEAVHGAVAEALGIRVLEMSRVADEFYDLPGRCTGGTLPDPAQLLGSPVEEMMIVLGPLRYSTDTAMGAAGDLDRATDIEQKYEGTWKAADERLPELFKMKAFLDLRTKFSNALWKQPKLNAEDIRVIAEKVR